MSSKIRSLARARERQQLKTNEITVSLDTLLNSGGSLGVLMGKDIPIRQSFSLGKIVKGVNAEIEQYNESRKSLCEKYSNKDGDGKPIMIDEEGKVVAEGQPGRYDIPKDKMAEFEKEHKELTTMQVSFPGSRIKVSDLGDIKIAAAHLMNLDWLIED